MNEEIAVRLYRHPERDACKHCGPYEPVDTTGWDFAVGDTIGLQDEFGGYTRGTIESIGADTHHDDQEDDDYKVAVLILED